MLPVWAAVLTAALLALLSPLAHACPFDPRLTAGSADDSDIDDLVDRVVAGAASVVRVDAIEPRPGRPLGLVAEVGSRYVSAVPASPCPTRAPPVLLARSF